MAEKGTPMWGFNKVRSILLPRFTLDIRKNEPGGLIKNECDQVSKCLKQFVSALSSLPNHRLRNKMIADAKRFADEYLGWNNHEGQEESTILLRRNQSVRLSKRRSLFSEKIGKQAAKISPLLTWQDVKRFVDALRPIPDSVPEKFENTRRGVEEVDKLCSDYW